MFGSLRIESLKKPAILIPLGLFVVSLLIRLAGIGWGLPNALHNQSYHPDETVNFGVSQASLLTPGFYDYGTAYFMVERLVSSGVAVYGGGPAGRDAKSFWDYVGRCILGGRVLNALAGAGAVVVLWLILRRITTGFGALFGAGLVALAPGFVVHSRFETVDVFATFWLMLSALFALRILGACPGSLAEPDARQPRDMRDAILAGLFAGISAGTKYTGILVLIVLWITLAQTRRPGWWIGLLAGSAVAIGAFLLTTPGAVLDSARFLKDFDYELRHTGTGHGLIFIDTPSGFIYHLINLAVGVGVLLSLSGMSGLVYGAVRKHRWAIALVAFGLIYYLLIGRAEVKFMRYIFPLLLPLAAGFGYAVGTARRRGGWGHLVVVLGIVALAGLDFGGLSGTVRYTQYMGLELDPRDEAALYLKRVAPNGTVGFVDDPWFYSPPLIPDAGLNRGQLPQIYREVAESSHPEVLRYIPTEGFDHRMDWDSRLLTEQKPDYVVFSDFEQYDVDRLSNAKDLDAGTQSLVKNYQAFMKVLDKNYGRVVPFGAVLPPIHDLRYIRPALWVWKRNDLR